MSKYPMCPWEEAERRGLTVYKADLHGLSGLNAANGIIFIDEGMTKRDDDSNLWHELGHHARGEVHISKDRKCKAERAADLYAAEHMVDPTYLKELAVLYPDDPGRIAYELGVADWVLEAYLQAYPEAMHLLDEAV